MNTESTSTSTSISTVATVDEAIAAYDAAAALAIETREDAESQFWAVENHVYAIIDATAAQKGVTLEPNGGGTEPFTDNSTYAFLLDDEYNVEAAICGPRGLLSGGEIHSGFYDAIEEALKEAAEDAALDALLEEDDDEDEVA